MYDSTLTVRRVRRSIQRGPAIPQPRWKTVETKCPTCRGKGVASRERRPDGTLWIEPCATCDGAGMLPKLVEA